MTVMATAAREVGIALLLVPVPLVIALLVGAARSDRVNAFLVWIVGLSLLPAIWLTALRLGWSGCAECLPKYDGGAMSFVLPAVPLSIAAMVLLFAITQSANRYAYRLTTRSAVRGISSHQRRLAITTGVRAIRAQAVAKMLL